MNVLLESIDLFKFMFGSQSGHHLAWSPHLSQWVGGSSGSMLVTWPEFQIAN